jgi:hypothetical protein
MLASPVDAGKPPLGERHQWSWKALPVRVPPAGPASRAARIGAQESVRCGARSRRAKKRTRTRRGTIDTPSAYGHLQACKPRPTRADRPACPTVRWGVGQPDCQPNPRARRPPSPTPLRKEMPRVRPARMLVPGRLAMRCKNREAKPPHKEASHGQRDLRLSGGFSLQGS